MSVHPYRQSAPETVEEEYRSVRLLIRKYAPAGKDIPIISGEWGYSTQYPAFAGKDAAARDEQQAKWLARQFLTNIANDVALSKRSSFRRGRRNQHARRVRSPETCRAQVRACQLGTPH